MKKILIILFCYISLTSFSQQRIGISPTIKPYKFGIRSITSDKIIFHLKGGITEQKSGSNYYADPNLKIKFNCDFSLSYIFRVYDVMYYFIGAGLDIYGKTRSYQAQKKLRIYKVYPLIVGGLEFVPCKRAPVTLLTQLEFNFYDYIRPSIGLVFYIF